MARSSLRAFVIASALAALLISVMAEIDVPLGDVPRVDVVEHPEFGLHLVDGAGVSLYVYALDEDGVSTCYGDCAQAWLPLLVDGLVGFGFDVDLGMLGSIMRDGGAHQLTYAGWPLYRFSGESPGEVSGHGVNDMWFLISPMGNVVAVAEPEGVDGDDEVAALLEEGADVFVNFCARCHGRNGDEDGGGATKLAGLRNLQNGPRTIRQVLFGGQYMPPFGANLSDRQVAAVVSHIRTSWGNDFDVVLGEEVTEVRQRFE